MIPHQCNLSRPCALCKRGVVPVRRQSATTPPDIYSPPLPPSAPSAPCDFLGERVYPPQAPDPVKTWSRCTNPALPLGTVVCPCRGCGPKCRGYAEDASLVASTAAQPAPDALVPSPQKEPPAVAKVPVRWACAITTVITRYHTLFPRTLRSLAAAGFPKPLVGFDECADPAKARAELGLEVAGRYPRIGGFGNWCLTLGELFVRNPKADRYLMVQDDVAFVGNLRAYLDTHKSEPNTYWNLYTFAENQKLAPQGDEAGFFKSNQRGLGALALVFSRQAVIDTLTSLHMVQRPLNAHRGHRNIDGGVLTALRKKGYTELCHSPTLCQHTGTGGASTMGSRDFVPAPHFPGEAADALQIFG